MASADSKDAPLETYEEETIPKSIYDPTRNRKLKKLTLEGFNHAFVDDIINMDVECPFCCMVIRNATQISACGHSFCATCWSDWTKEEPVYCPVDNEVVDSTDVFKDRKHDRFILGLRVHCDNKDFGCKATPELRDIQIHMEKCEYQTTSCELMCGEKMLLLSLDDHMKVDCPRRMLECPTCQSVLMALEIQVHSDKCAMKVISCDLCKCPDILIKDLCNHQSECPKYPTYCNFALVGCTNKVVREELESHHKSSTQEHLHLLNAALCNLYTDVGSRPLSKEANDKHRALELPAALWGKVRKDKSEALIEWSELPQCVYRVHSDDSKGDSLSETVSILMETNKKMARDIDKLSFLYGCTSKLLQRTTIAPCELVEGSINIRPCKWKVGMKRGSQYSPSFYTLDGYCMRFCVVNRGTQSNGQWLCHVGVVLVKGKNDENVTWPRPDHDERVFKYFLVETNKPNGTKGTYSHNNKTTLVRLAFGDGEQPSSAKQGSFLFTFEIRPSSDTNKLTFTI